MIRVRTVFVLAALLLAAPQARADQEIVAIETVGSTTTITVFARLGYVRPYGLATVRLDVGDIIPEGVMKKVEPPDFGGSFLVHQDRTLASEYGIEVTIENITNRWARPGGDGASWIAQFVD